MNYLSLFSGIEAATVAWEPLGWKPVAFAEVEPFPNAVLSEHFSNVPNLGDVTQITDDDIAALGPVDVVVGGSPCQDLSLAGKRAGLAGTRSGLFHEQLRLFHAARTLCGARWLVWENVPGAFSSNSGQDFAVVVGTMVGTEFPVPENGWQTAGACLGPNGLVEWRVLDAQWFGLAQRRRRVFAVLDVGNWQSRQPVLLESESLFGNPQTRRAKREDIAPTISARTNGGGGLGTDFECDGGLIAFDSKAGAHFTSSVEVAPALRAMNGINPNGGGQLAVAFDMRGRDGGAMPEGPHDTVNIRAASGGSSRSYIATPNRVRRLTPVECERLMGFPDNYTRIPWRNQPTGQCPDGPRYKALGNSMAVPVMRWIGRRLAEAANTVRIA